MGETTAKSAIKIIPATTVEQAKLIYQLTQAAFGEYVGVLPSPPSALSEQLEDVLAYLPASPEAFPTKKGAILAYLSSDGSLEADKLAGVARYSVQPDCFYISRVAVAAAYRRYGIGSFLMHHLEEEIARLYFSGLPLRLGTRQTLPRNIAFYQKLGYTVTQIEPYPAGIPDCNISMSKILEVRK